MREDEAKESDLEMKTRRPMSSTENAAASFILTLLVIPLSSSPIILISSTNILMSGLSKAPLIVPLGIRVGRSQISSMSQVVQH